MSMDSTASACLADDGRPKSANELYDQVERFAVKLAREVAQNAVGRLGLSVSDARDVEQELLTHLVQKLSRFDPSRGRLTTFAAAVIKNKMTSMIRFQRREKRDFRKCNPLSPDGDRGTSSASRHRGETIDDRLGRSHLQRSPRDQQEQFDLRDDLCGVVAELGPHEAEICQLLAEGQTPGAVAETLCTTKYRVTKTIGQILRRFSDRGLENYLENS